MKKFLSLTLAALMLLSAIALVACDFDTALDIDDVTAETEAVTETQDNSSTGSGSGSGSVVGNTGPLPENDLSSGTEVGALGNMTPYQLYLNAGEQISTATQFQLYGYEIEDGKKSELTVKLSANSVYQSMTTSEGLREAWLVDGVTYQKQGDNKVKNTDITYDEVKTSVMRYLVGYYMQGIKEAAFENVKLMKTANDVYFFTLEVGADDELAAMVGNEAFSYKMAFDKDGGLAQIEFVLAENPEDKIVFVYDIGETPAVAAPADAATYREAGTGNESTGKETGTVDTNQNYPAPDPDDGSADTQDNSSATPEVDPKDTMKK